MNSIFLKIFLGILFLSPVYANNLDVSQKLTDKPIDKAIRIKTHDKGNYCYAPVFTGGEGYIYIDNCSSSNVKFARYDVFQRISYKINDTWLCITAPASVTESLSSTNWDYVVLRPCVINDPNQRWIVKNNAFWTADERFRLKDYGWYAYISKNPSDYYDHTLDSSMNTWINTVATPGNISSQTLLSWIFFNSSEWGIYYIENNRSAADRATSLYYNPENGHIAQYYPNTGSLYCMTSNTTDEQDWNWVSWNYCSDSIPKNKDNMYWDISFMVQNEGGIRDYKKNILRLTQYGTNWGVPYTVKPSYIKSDTTNKPLSKFSFSHDIENWVRYVNANLSETLQYCPAPGKKSSQNTRVKRSLPPDFKLNEEWRKRLYNIATSTDSTTTKAGVCGTCLLHTYQIIAELQEYYPRAPLSSGGYFFNTAPSADPFVSLQQRFPSVYGVMENAPTWYGVALTPSDTSDSIAARVAFSTTQSVLPGFNWSLSNLATNRLEIMSLIRNMIEGRPGTIWIALITHTLPDGSIGRHALPIIRSAAGLKLIPTNTSMSFFDFTDFVSDTTDPNLVYLRLSNRGTANITSVGLLELTGAASNPVSVTFSENNCTGEGDDRRGSARTPSSALVNQCASGRCSF
ncbi:hypothetical protein BKH42_01700 [Helicobacter sp. 13S00482-2]|uniref:DUF1561 family protein n=1 Tax=Helicobacter sp. 13S00482-2 TaxID=1476200 RepID=UPI000BA5F6A1|nr:DUF1561 family protein [Helicobacter sp. 13S00482-2]PAF54245.1 hypothetical protein BKH42_01700 [Helicobacter sp. 13S00482-2]